MVLRTAGCFRATGGHRDAQRIDLPARRALPACGELHSLAATRPGGGASLRRHPHAIPDEPAAHPARSHPRGVSQKRPAHRRPLEWCGRKPRLHFSADRLGGQCDTIGRAGYGCDCIDSRWRLRGALRRAGAQPVANHPAAGFIAGALKNTGAVPQTRPLGLRYNERFARGVFYRAVAMNFKLSSNYEPQGDQPQALCELVRGLEGGEKHQVLLGVTGSGKTFTMAKVIEQINRPSLVLAHNKTLAAQLYHEFRSFFPPNAVEYFVSYYDYYLPEAYIPRTDTYIEKESSINEQIDRMRHSATRAILERRDTIIVASVSCIYGIGSVETYADID